jgi:hypothetical protein
MFVLTATYELRVSGKTHLRDHPNKNPPKPLFRFSCLLPSFRKVRSFLLKEFLLTGIPQYCVSTVLLIESAFAFAGAVKPGEGEEEGDGVCAKGGGEYRQPEGHPATAHT